MRTSTQNLAPEDHGLGALRDDVEVTPLAHAGHVRLARAAAALDLGPPEKAITDALDGERSATDVARLLLGAGHAIDAADVLALYRELAALDLVTRAPPPGDATVIGRLPDATAPGPAEPTAPGPAEPTAAEQTRTTSTGAVLVEPTATRTTAAGGDLGSRLSEPTIDEPVSDATGALTTVTPSIDEEGGTPAPSWYDATSDGATIVDPFAVDRLMRAARAEVRPVTEVPTDAQPLEPLDRTAAGPTTSFGSDLETARERPAHARASAAVTTVDLGPPRAAVTEELERPVYPRFEAPLPGNYPRLEPVEASRSAGPAAISAMPAAPPPTDPAAPLHPSGGYPLVRALDLRLGRRALAVAGGALGLVIIVSAIAARGGGSTGNAGWLAAIEERPGPPPFVIEHAAHPRATLTSPIAGTIASLELASPRVVAGGDRLFVVRPPGKGARQDVLAPFGGRARPLVAEGSKIDRGSPIAELVDETTWHVQGRVAHAAVTSGWSCEVGEVGGSGRVPCQIAEVVPDGEAGLRVALRVAADDAPWFDATRATVLLSPPSTR